MRCVLAGVDGSAEATTAARWAADEAASRGVPLRLVSVVVSGDSSQGKIVASSSVRPYGRRGSLATYDIRTTLDDPITRRIFALHWRTVSPFVKSIMRATLRTAVEHARS